MYHGDGHLKYNLLTSAKLGYVAGTVRNTKQYKLTVTIKRDGTAVYSESIMLESK